MAITADNAANNNTFIKELGCICSRKKIDFDYKKNNIRCLAHIINLTVQEILKYVKAEDAQEEDKILESISQEDQVNSNVEIIPKLRRLIVKIRSSPQRKEKFSRHCEFYLNNNSLNLILDVKTRWNSTYFMLDRALKLRDVSKLFVSQ